MKSIQRNFSKISTDNPYWSTIICFAHIIRKKRYHYQVIKKYFNLLVDKDDYDKKDKKQILDWLRDISNPPN